MKAGIVSYGSYLPAFAISSAEIGRSQPNQGDLGKSLGVDQKTVPSLDEDTATMATEAAWQAISRWSGQLEQIQALFIGSESHPYAVKPTGTVVKQALGLAETMSVADFQFACKAGTQAMQSVLAHVESDLAKIGLAIGSDVAQSEPGDVLEFTAGAGAAALLMGKKNILVKIIDTISVASDTPDFWRRPAQNYPQHTGRFTGEPAYFQHVLTTTQQILNKNNLSPADIDYCIFHTPNGKFPSLAAKELGFSRQQLEPSLVVKKIGNTYAAASLLALVAVLDRVPAHKLILLTSYGSGAGSDSFLLKTTPLLSKFRKNWANLLSQQISTLTPITYQDYSFR